MAPARSCLPTILKSTIASGSGISSEGAEWIEIGRGMQSDIPDDHGGRRGKNSTSEVYIRNMLQAWLRYMTNRHAMRAA